MDRERKKVEEWNKIILSTKDLVLKERPVKKLIECYIELYVIKKIVLRNAVKLKLLVFINWNQLKWMVLEQLGEDCSDAAEIMTPEKS